LPAGVDEKVFLSSQAAPWQSADRSASTLREDNWEMLAGFGKLDTCEQYRVVLPEKRKPSSSV
jgi:hypothetical protein